MIANEDLVNPFERGEEIVIPKGVLVKSLLPSRKSYVTKRRLKVTLDRADNGMRQRVVYMSDKDRRRHPEHAQAYKRYDDLMLDAATNPDPAEASRLLKEAYEMYVFLHEPEVHWAGSGRYWCHAPLAAVLEANFRAPKNVAKH